MGIRTRFLVKMFFYLIRSKQPVKVSAHSNLSILNISGQYNSKQFRPYLDFDAVDQNFIDPIWSKLLCPDIITLTISGRGVSSNVHWSALILTGFDHIRETEFEQFDQYTSSTSI